ncbi:MAG: hypothetical protein V9G20_31270 [Candidatus Promineifilaceae bacterium]
MKKKHWSDSRTLSVLVVGVAVGTAGLTFMYKLYEFIAAAAAGYMPGIITASVMPYFFISAGFLLLAAWAWAGGHYRQIEGPKRDMLQQEEEYEKLEQRDKLFY